MITAISSNTSGAMDSFKTTPIVMKETILTPIPVDLIIEESSTFVHCLPALIAIFLMFIVMSLLTFVIQGDNFQKKFKEPKRVLLVTAHPDDECMFFGPTVTQLASKAEVYLMCLSNGGFEGIGVRRSRELWLSCNKLGIVDGNIRLYRHPLLLDNPTSSWSPLLIAHLILQFIETFCIDTLITFDAYGVSGHSNHSAIYRAVMHLTGKRGIPSYCRIYILESVNILRKYSMCADLFLSCFLSKYMYVCSAMRRQMILDAMSQHSSQLLWYRRLFLIFSRYTYINTFRLIS